MKRFSGKLVLAAALVAAVLSLPFWMPALQSAAAEPVMAADVDANPFSPGSTFYLFDSGYFTGESLQTVHNAPQVVTWVGGDDAEWTTETGFIMGSLVDAEGGRILVTEQRNTTVDSLQGLSYPADSTYPPSETWPVYLTVLDTETGEVLSRERVPDLSVGPTGYYLHPVGVDGDVVYLSNYDTIRNLHSYNLSTKTVGEQYWDICERGYIMDSLLLTEPTRVAALCDQGLTITDMTTGEQHSVKIPQLGSLEYETGNGMFVANDQLYVVDSNGGVMLTVDSETLQLSKIIDYRASIEEAKSNIIDQVFTWLGEQIVGSAQAKRWMAITSVSADERWLAIDGGMLSPVGIREILVVDLHGEDATRSFELDGSPSRMAFGDDGNLLVVFEGSGSLTSAVLLHVDSGETMTVNLPFNGWLQNLIAARN